MAVYVRTQIQNPVLSLTASVTLRDQPIKAKKAGANVETSSIYSAADTVRTDGTEEVEAMEEEEEEEDLAGMEEIDLLGGLGECFVLFCKDRLYVCRYRASMVRAQRAVADPRRRASAHNTARREPPARSIITHPVRTFCPSVSRGLDLRSPCRFLYRFYLVCHRIYTRKASSSIDAQTFQPYLA